MPTVQQLIDFFRANNYIGHLNPITARNPALHFNISDGGVEVVMRDVIREAIKQGQLIGSNSHGFYIIDDLPEIEHNLNSLQSRAEKILQRRRNLLNDWNNIPNQNNPTNLTDLIIEINQ
jgi:hypothetical protein